MSDLFERNLAALTRTSPETAAAVRAAGNLAEVGLSRAASGDVVVEIGGRALDSRRDPRAAADRLAEHVTSDPVVVAGFAGGYLPEALARRGTRVVAVIESSPQVLAAAMMRRDLGVILDDVPVVLTRTLQSPVDLATLRAQSETLVPHGPSVVGDGDLAALVEGWSDIRVASRPPRVLVVSPIAGGSLGIARSAARACATAGAETRLFDAAEYADANRALERLAASQEVRRSFQGEFAQLIGRAVVSTTEGWRPDLVLALAQAPLDATAVGRLRSLGICTAFWFVENGRVLTYWRHVAALYDRFYAIQPGRFLEQLSDAGAEQPAYLPVACDPTEHHPRDLSADERERYGADISFAGSAYLNRRRIFSKLTDLPLRLWGPGWTDAVLAPLAAEGGRSFDLEQMARIFAATRINLNLHSANHVETCDPDPDYVNPRTFELASSGAFQLVDRRDPLSELFAADEVVTFEDVRQLRSLIARYLADPDGRQAIATRARSRALTDHTYVHRMRRVLRDTLSPELAAAAASPAARPTRLPEAIKRREVVSPTLEPEEALMRAVHAIQTIGVSG